MNFKRRSTHLYCIKCAVFDIYVKNGKHSIQYIDIYFKVNNNIHNKPTFKKNIIITKFNFFFVRFLAFHKRV